MTTKNEPQTLEAAIAPALVINAPHFFQDSEFVAWLNDKQETKFTWHKEGVPGEYSDVVVCVDPGLNGEGSDSDMPSHIWEEIVATCRRFFSAGEPTHHIMVRLTNLRDDAPTRAGDAGKVSLTNGQLAAVLTHLLTNPFAGEIDDQGLFEEFCGDLLDVITDYCGGKIVTHPAYAPSPGCMRWDQHYRMEVRSNESSPEDGGIWAKVANICSLPSSAKPSEETGVLPAIAPEPLLAPGEGVVHQGKRISMLSHGILDHLPRGSDGEVMQESILAHVQSVLDTCIKVADEQWVKDPRVSGGEAIRKIIP